MAKRYKIELTERQLIAVEKYIEITMRLFMGQDDMFSNEIAELNTDLKSDNPKHHVFDRFIQRRDHIREVMKAVFQIAFEPWGYLKEKSEEMMIIECIWDSIRFYRGVSRWNHPFQIGSEPSPKIEVIDDEKEGEDD